MLNDDQLWMLCVRKIAGQLFEKHHVVRVVRGAGGAFDRLCVLRHLDFASWLKRCTAASLSSSNPASPTTSAPGYRSAPQRAQSVSSIYARRPDRSGRLQLPQALEADPNVPPLPPSLPEATQPLTNLTDRIQQQYQPRSPDHHPGSPRHHHTPSTPEQRPEAFQKGRRPNSAAARLGVSSSLKGRSGGGDGGGGGGGGFGGREASPPPPPLLQLQDSTGSQPTSPQLEAVAEVEAGVAEPSVADTGVGAPKEDQLAKELTKLREEQEREHHQETQQHQPPPTPPPAPASNRGGSVHRRPPSARHRLVHAASGEVDANGKPTGSEVVLFSIPYVAPTDDATTPGAPSPPFRIASSSKQGSFGRASSIGRASSFGGASSSKSSFTSPPSDRHTLRLRSPAFGTTRPRLWTHESASGRIHGEPIPAGWSSRHEPRTFDEHSSEASNVNASTVCTSPHAPPHHPHSPTTPGGISAPFHPNAPLAPPATPTSSNADGRWPSQQRTLPKNNASHLPSRLFMTGVGPSPGARPTFKADLAAQNAERLYTEFRTNQQHGQASPRDAPQSAPQSARPQERAAGFLTPNRHHRRPPQLGRASSARGASPRSSPRSSSRPAHGAAAAARGESVVYNIKAHPRRSVSASPRRSTGGVAHFAKVGGRWHVPFERWIQMDGVMIDHPDADMIE